MAEVILTMWMSLDGFITGPNDVEGNGLGDGGDVLHAELGEVDTDSTTARPTDPDGAAVFDELIATGAVLTGRRTFDIAGEWAGDHHDGVPIFVLTRTEREPKGHVRYVTDAHEAVALAKAAAGDRDILMHGASAAQALLREGLLDEIELALVPVLLGRGRRLFDDLDQIPLEKVRVLDGANGVVHVRYRVRR